VKWVDTSLGPSRNGDLASNTGTTLGATMVMVKGCRAVGDGGDNPTVVYHL